MISCKFSSIPFVIKCPISLFRIIPSPFPTFPCILLLAFCSLHSAPCTKFFAPSSFTFSLFYSLPIYLPHPSALSRPILSCPVLPYPYPILSYPVLSCPVLPCPALIQLPRLQSFGHFSSLAHPEPLRTLIFLPRLQSFLHFSALAPSSRNRSVQPFG